MCNRCNFIHKSSWLTLLKLSHGKFNHAYKGFSKYIWNKDCGIIKAGLKDHFHLPWMLSATIQLPLKRLICYSKQPIQIPHVSLLLPTTGHSSGLQLKKSDCKTSYDCRNSPAFCKRKWIKWILLGFANNIS